MFAASDMKIHLGLSLAERIAAGPLQRGANAEIMVVASVQGFEQAAKDVDALDSQDECGEFIYMGDDSVWVEQDYSDLEAFDYRCGLVVLVNGDR
jgi:hypothetical protein